MISFTKVETKNIDEERLFKLVKEYLFSEEAVNEYCDYIDIVDRLPEDVQRLIFAKVGAMMIDYAGSEEF